MSLSFDKSTPILQNPIKDPARFEWDEVKKIETKSSRKNRLITFQLKTNF